MTQKIKKLIPYILLLIIMVGVFVPGVRVDAQGTPPATVTCTDSTGTTPVGCVRTPLQVAEENCKNLPNSDKENCINQILQGIVERGTTATTATPPEKDTLADEATRSCGIIVTGSLGGCLIAFFYFIFGGVASLLLVIAAKFFNILVGVSLSTHLYGGYLKTAWTIVRDISNIFFILILLYIGVSTILGIGGSTAKKMIAHVVIMALLINFSMFFTKIVIDTSNVLALIFYNKIDTSTVVNGEKKEINYTSSLKSGEKDLAGGLVKAFNPTKLLDEPFFKKLRKTNEFSFISLAAYAGGGAAAGAPFAVVGAIPGALGASAYYLLNSAGSQVPTSLMLGIILVTGLIMGYAAYVLFRAGLAFLSRIIELWIMIIFSPFAFMSFAVPQLESIPYIGWKAWSARLIEVSFMAPIFLFFLYFIFILVQADPIGNLAVGASPDQHWLEVLLLLIIPALLILILLNKAADYAKSASGKLGDAVTKFAGVAIGAAGAIGFGAAGTVLQATLGRAGSAIAASGKLKGAESKGVFGAKALRNVGLWAENSPFDARKGVLGAGIKGLEAVSGFDLTGAKLGGFTNLLTKKDSYKLDAENRRVAREKRAQSLEVGKNEPLQQDLNRREEEHQDMLEESSHILKENGDAIENTRKDAEDKRNASSVANLEMETKKLEYNKVIAPVKEVAEKVKAELERISINYKNAQDEAKAAEDAATKAEALASTTGTDEAKSAAATARVNAISKEEFAKNKFAQYLKAESEAIRTESDFNAIKTSNVALETAATNAENDYIQKKQDATEAAEKLKILKDHKKAIKGAKGNAGSAANLVTAITNLGTAETDLGTAESALAAAIGTAGEAIARDNVKLKTKARDLAKRKKEIAQAERASYQYGKDASGNARSIDDYADVIIPHAHHAIEKENRRRKIQFVKNTGPSRTRGRLGDYSGFEILQVGFHPSEEANHNIRMNAKVPEGGGSKGGGHH